MSARLVALLAALALPACGAEEEPPSVPMCEYRDGGYGLRDEKACKPRAYPCTLADGGRGVCQ